jgi:hypothetical protein
MAETVRTWEYLTIEEQTATPQELAELGRQGWELVGAVGGNGSDRLYFKRPGLSFRERVTLDQKRRYYGLWGVTLAGEDRVVGEPAIEPAGADTAAKA